jgi:hypothetical protein
LARSFRYYGKKRGNRRTGSPAWGSVGEAFFFAVFLLLGCGGTVAMLTHVVLPQWRVNHEFVETTCKVLDKRIGQQRDADGLVYRPEFYVKYEVGGVTYGNWHYDIQGAYSGEQQRAQAILGRFEVYDAAKNNLYPCWYDPTNPDVAVLVREGSWWEWFLFTVPLSFVVIGAGGLIYTLLRWGKSAERRAAMAQRAQERDFFSAGGNGQHPYPFVPLGADLTNSPGTKLRFRLPMATSPGWALFGTLAFCIVWNGIAWVFAVMAVRGHLAGRPDWFLTLFAIPFILIGLGAVAVFFRQLLLTTGIGPTLVEVSNHPLEPGGQCRVFLSQSGRLTINALRVSLVCEEAATYRQGTNTRTETQEVYRRELFRREGFAIESGLPFETEIELSVPEGAMHSFKANHNEITWSLAVEADVAKWPNYRRSFPLVVRPINGSVDR